jgi:hypothetical protein
LPDNSPYVVNVKRLVDIELTADEEWVSEIVVEVLEEVVNRGLLDVYPPNPTNEIVSGVTGSLAARLRRDVLADLQRHPLCLQVVVPDLLRARLRLKV